MRGQVSQAVRIQESSPKELMDVRDAAEEPGGSQDSWRVGFGDEARFVVSATVRSCCPVHSLLLCPEA